VRRIRPQIVKAILMLFGVANVWACQEIEPESQTVSQCTVGFYAGSPATRTSFGSNGLSASWEAGDKVSLWAKNSSGTYTLDNQVFTLYADDQSLAFFTSVLNSPMAEGEYAYYATYPSPVSVSGTKATFVLPAQQNGLADGGLDVMVAAPATYGPLAAIADPEDHSRMSLSMNHMLHFFRLFTPEDNDALSNEEIQKVVVTFERSVAGSFTVDFTDPSAPAAFAGTSNTVTMDLESPIAPSTADAFEYAYLPLAPFAADEDESFTMKVYTETKVGTTDPVVLGGRTFLAGHSTAVKILPTSVSNRCKLYFKIADNFLGEPVKKFIFTGPTGCRFGDGGTNTYTYESETGMKAGDSFFIDYEVEADYRTMSQADIAIVFESDHARVNGSVTVPSLATGYNATVNMTVPYLYFEDFSSTTVSSDYNSSNGVGATASGSNTAVDLSKSSYGWPSGWTGARCGIKAGTDIRLCCRSQKAAYIPGNYNSRVDSPAFDNMLSGVGGVPVKVEFDYSFGWHGSKSNTIQQYMTVGTHQTSGLIDASSGVGSPIVGGALAGTTIDSEYIIAKDVNQPAIETDNDTWIAPSYHFSEVSSQLCTNANRLVFEVYMNTDSGDGYYNYWVYIDNIKVSIASDN